MRAIGRIETLEVLEVVWWQSNKVRLSPKEIFSACPNLKGLALTVESGSDGMMLSVTFMERRGGGASYSIMNGTSLDRPYLQNGWFYYKTQDKILGRPSAM